MITLTANPAPLDALADRLRAAAPVVEDAVAREVEAVAGAVALDASLYPPQPPGSTYARTYTLERAWDTDGGGLAWAATNATPYAEWVMGATQARANTHWRTVGTIAAQWAPQATDRVAEAAQRALEAQL